MSVTRLLITVYFQHSALYSIWIFLWMDGSAADSALACKQFSNPDTETTVFKDDGCFLLSREERTWEESKTCCNGLGDGWSLVVIEDVETQKHVDNVTRTAGVSTGSWIGLRQRNGFTWVSGNKLGYLGFFKLADGEVQAPGDCVTTSPPDDTSLYGIWSHMDCTTRLYSICHSGSPLPPRKTTTCRPTTSSKPPAKPPTTVKYGARQSTAATTQSTASTTQSTAATTLSTAATTQSTAATKQSTEATKQSTAATKQSTAATKQSTAATKQSIAATKQSTAATKQSTASSITSTATTTQFTAATTSSTTVLIAVSSTAAFVAAVFLVGGVIVLCRRNKQKRLRVTMAGDDTESGTAADVRTKPEVEYAVVTKIQTKQSSQVNDCNTQSGYHYASVDDGALPMTQGVNDQTYDTATITEKKQPITFDNTYARAIFSQSASDTGGDVYDHTRVSGKASQEVDASHYDHAFVK